MTSRVHLMFTVVSSAMVLIAIVWGVTLVGSPTTARLLRFDERRINDLRTIHRELQRLCHDEDLRDSLKRPLPKTLDELATIARTERINVRDPETGEPYAYSVTGPTTYELCATFALTRDSDVDVFWNHPPGRYCFTVDALDPP